MSAALKATPSRAALAAFVVTGLLAGAWLWTAIPTHDAGALQPRLRRAAYIERAHTLATSFGVDASAWRIAARLAHDNNPENRVLQGQLPSGGMQWPARYVQVTLASPDGGRRVVAHLTEDGHVLSWKLEGNDGELTTPERGSIQVPLRSIAEMALHEVAADHAAEFRASWQGKAPDNGTVNYEATDARLGAVRWQVHVEFRNARLVRVELDPDITDRAFFRNFRWNLTAYDVRGFGFVCFVLFSIFATLSGVQAVRRGSWDRTLLATSAVALALALAWSWTSGPAHESYLEAATSGDGEQTVFGLIVGLAWTAWLWMAAEAQAQRGATNAWAGLRMALSGRVASLTVWRATAIGLAGGALVAFVHAAPALFWTHEALWRAMGVDALSRAPLSGALAALADPEFVALPLFATSWLLRPKSIWIRVALGALSIVLLTLSQIRGDASGLVLVGIAVVSAPLLMAIYWYGGALALVTALLGARLWPAACAGMNGEAALALSAFGAGALLFAWRQPEPVSDRWLPCDESNLPSTRRERLQAEFGDARDAQRRLLPSAAPALDGYEIAAVCLPATDVGGDLYDFHTLPDGRTLFSVADVSGKGMPAALYMTLSKGVLAAVCQEHSDPRLIATHCNRTIHAASSRTLGVSKVFVTAALAALDAATGALDVIRAGHNPPLLVRANGEASFLKPTGLAFGLTGAVIFDSRIGVTRVKLAPGDAFVLYSDGITEAMDREQAEFGEDRLQDVFSTPASAEALRERVVDAVREFAAGAPQHDDMTLVVIRRIR